MHICMIWMDAIELKPIEVDDTENDNDITRINS